MAANPKLPKRNDLSQGVVDTAGIWEWSKTSAWAVCWSTLRMSMHLLFPIRSICFHLKCTSFLSCTKTKQEYFHFIFKQYGLINMKDPLCVCVLLQIFRGVWVLRERKPGVGRSSCAGGVRQQLCVPAHRAQRNIWSNHRGSSCWFWWSWVKLRQSVGVLSTQQSGCWSMVFYSHLRKEMQTMVISCSGKRLPKWDMCLARQGRSLSWQLGGLTALMIHCLTSQGCWEAAAAHC